MFCVHKNMFKIFIVYLFISEIRAETDPGNCCDELPNKAAKFLDFKMSNTKWVYKSCKFISLISAKNKQNKLNKSDKCTFEVTKHRNRMISISLKGFLKIIRHLWICFVQLNGWNMPLIKRSNYGVLKMRNDIKFE